MKAGWGSGTAFFLLAPACCGLPENERERGKHMLQKWNSVAKDAQKP